jgi:integrase
LIFLKNPISLRYATRSQYLAAILTFYDLNELILNKKKIYRYLGEEERPIENRGYTIEEIAKMLEVCDEGLVNMNAYPGFRRFIFYIL